MTHFLSKISFMSSLYIANEFEFYIAVAEHFDVIITCEEKCYDAVLAVFEERTSSREQPVHVLNMDIVDNQEDATIGAFILCELAQSMRDCEDLDDELEELVQEFETKYKRDLLHTVLFY